MCLSQALNTAHVAKDIMLHRLDRQIVRDASADLLNAFAAEIASCAKRAWYTIEVRLLAMTVKFLRVE